MSRIIDADKIDLRVPYSVDSNGDILVPLSSVRQAIAMTPTENVARIVCCKGCKHSTWIQEPCHGKPVYRCNLLGLEVSKHFYCARGERKNGGYV